MKISTTAVSSALSVLILGSVSAFAASALTLKLEGARPEVKKMPMEEVNIQSYHFAAAAKTGKEMKSEKAAREAAKIAPAAGGKMLLKPVSTGAGSLTVMADEASINSLCAGEKRFDKATLATSSGTFVMHDVNISGCVMGGEKQAESLSFNYAKINTMMAKTKAMPMPMTEKKMKEETMKGKMIEKTEPKPY